MQSTCLEIITHTDEFPGMIGFHMKTSSFPSFQNFNASSYPSCPSASCIFIKYNDEGLFQRNLFNLQIYNAIAFLWCVNFVIALGQCTLAGAFASYYWAFNKPEDIPMFPVSAAFMRTLRLVSKQLSLQCQTSSVFFIESSWTEISICSDHFAED